MKMSKMSELYYDIQEMYIEGVSAKRIAQILGCSLEDVYAVLEDMGVADAPQEDYDPFNTVNS
jgi:hypothetical protein